MKVDKNVPITFEKVKEIDSRFTAVKIWLMHLGLNYNRSIFTKDAVMRAMDTLKNTPILGYIEESENGELDFKGHESELTVEDGELKVKYIGKALGVIPENCNPRFEFKEGDYGQQLEYLVVDGLLWTRFEDAVSILDNQDGEVGQSMELDDKYDGYWDGDNNFVFEDFSFNGACLLGADVLPAMQKASVEKVMFSKVDVFQDEIAKKLNEFQLAFNKKLSKEVEHVNLEALLAKYNLSLDNLTEKGIVAEDFSMEELEEKIKEVFETQSEPVVEPEPSEPVVVMENEPTDPVEPTEPVVEPEFQADPEPKDDKVYRKFGLSHDDVRVQLWSKLDSYVEEKGIGERWDFWISEVYDDHLIIQHDYNRNYFKVGYSKENDDIVLGENVQVFAQYLTAEEKGALELMRNNYESFEKENTELKDFKSNVLKHEHESEVESLIANFEKLTDEDVAEIRSDVHNFTLEQVESKLYEIMGRKTVVFSKEPKKNTSVKLSVKDDEKVYTGIDSIFAKHGIKK